MNQLNNTVLGLGFIGDIPTLSKEELDKLTISYDFQVNIFDLSKEQDLVRYREILNDIAAGKSILRKEDIQFINGKWLVLLIWAKLFIKEKQNGKGNTNRT